MKSVKIGDISLQDDIDVAIETLTALARTSVDAYIAINSSTSPIPGMAIIGRRGQRIGEHEGMTETQEDVY